MAIGEVGTFLPAESAYGTPGAYSQALRAESTKRAAYLSQMDQFYASLEESKRQFEETMTFREESWEDEMSLRRGEMTQRRRESGMNWLLGLYQAKTQRLASRRGSSGGGITLGGRDEKLDLLRDMWEAEQGGRSLVPSTPRYGKDYDPYDPGLPYDPSGRYDQRQDY